ncbi:MAG TPA: endonuclease/exonuclease/phosphatase family protein, partial [Pseudolabrys sp.]
MTLNLWNINEPLEPRYRALAAGLRKLRPDIVCLQEIYRDPGSGRSQADLVAEMCGLAHHTEESGLSILSSQPVLRLSSTALPHFPGDPLRHVMLAEYLFEGRPLLVINTHLAYAPEMIEGRRRQAQAVLAAIKRQYSRRKGV